MPPLVPALLSAVLGALAPRIVSGALEVSLPPVWLSADALAFVGDDGIELRWYRVGLNGAEPEALTFTPPPESPRLVWWSPGRGECAYIASDAGNRTLFLCRLGSQRSEPLSIVGEGASAVGWSTDGQRLAFARRAEEGQPQPYEVFVLNADGSGPMVRIPMPGPTLSIAWSWDGTRFAYVSLLDRTPRLYVTWLDRRAALPCSAHLAVRPDSVAWSPSDRNLSFAAAPNVEQGWRLHLARSHCSLPAERLGSGYAGLPPAVWSVDGRWLAWTQGSLSHAERGVLMLAPTSDLRRARRVGRSVWCDGATFDPASRRLAYTAYESLDPVAATVWIEPLEDDGRPLEIGAGPVTTTPQFSPDGRRLAVLTGDRARRGLAVIELEPLTPEQAERGPEPLG